MQAELCRLVTAGSVDDGKSTLIGRLLYDTKQILTDQLEHIEDASRRRGHDYVDLALLVDGLRGVVEHTRRHAYITAILETPHVVFAVNKMDLVDFDEETFRGIEG